MKFHKNINHDFNLLSITFGTKNLKTNIPYGPMDVFYKIIKHQLCHTFTEARVLFAITCVLKIHVSVFRAHPREIVHMVQDEFRIFDIFRISAFIKYFMDYCGFLVYRPRDPPWPRGYDA